METRLGWGRLAGGGWLAMMLACVGLGGIEARAERVMAFSGGAGTLPAVVDLQPGATSDFAVELWFRPDAGSTGPGAILTNDDYANLLRSDIATGGWGLYWENGVVRMARRPSAGKFGVNMAGSRSDPFPAAAGQWHYVVVNFKRDSKIRVYLDGNLVETVDSLASWSYNGRTFEESGPFGKQFRLGNDPSGGNAFKGAVDEVRFWNSVRTPDDMANAFQKKTQLSGSEPGLVAYLQFNEATGNPLVQGKLAAQRIVMTLTATGASRIDDAGLVLGPAAPPATDWMLTFNGANQSMDTGLPASKLSGRELTIEYWFKGSRLLSAVRAQGRIPAGDVWVVSGWGNPVQHLVRVPGHPGVSVQGIGTGKSVDDGFWHHYAMTWKSGDPKGFVGYFDGGAVQEVATPDIPIDAGGGNIWLGSFNGSSEYLQGSLDEVRIWNRALTAAELRDRATGKRRLFGFEPGLIAYYTFNVREDLGDRDLISKVLGTFNNMTGDSRAPQAELVLGDPLVVRNPNPAMAGLWIGEVSLKRVGRAGKPEEAPSEAAGSFDFNVVLHANANGEVRLVKDVTLMQSPRPGGNLTDVVLLTDDTLIPQYQGVVKRGGKMVGVRYSSAFYQFADETLPMFGGLGFAHALSATNLMPASLATHPFRHRFHPTHKDPKDLKGTAYDLERRIEVLFRETKTLPGEGNHRLRGTYRETWVGLHRQPLVAEGEISLERISLVNKLNNR